MSSAKTIAKNTGFLFSTEIFDKLLSFFLIIVITRYLGNVGYGKYSFAFAFIGLFIVLSHFGLTTYIFREIARNKSKSKKLIGNVFTLRLVLLAIVYLIMILTAWNLPKTREIIAVIFLVMVHELFTAYNYLMGVIFQAYERNEFNLYSIIIDKGGALLFGAYVLISGYGLSALLYALILSKIISFAFRYIICYVKCVKIFPKIDFKIWRILIKNSFPFWLTKLFEVAYYHIDKVMLTGIKNYAVTGWYSAASTLIAALTFIPMVIVNSTFPAMSRFYHTNSKDFLKLLYKKSFYYLVLIGVPISIGIVILAQRIVLFIYKEQFSESGIVLQILSGVLVLLFINYIMGYLLNSINKQYIFSISNGACISSNIAINFILIPKFSYIGAAYATIISQFINFCILYYFTSKNGYPINILQVVYKPLIAGGIMAFTIIYLKFLPILYIIPIAAMAYFISLFLIKGIGKEEIELVKSFISRKS
jgi:O-antigen/teichoic acid export membrane protein